VGIALDSARFALRTAGSLKNVKIRDVGPFSTQSEVRRDRLASLIDVDRTSRIAAVDVAVGRIPDLPP
jgi:hypothetical protein